MEDEKIVDLFWQRSDRAIAETDRKYGRYCHTIAYHICGLEEDAEECVNDTWYRAWNLMPDQRPTVLSAFLGRITRSISIDRIRAKNRRRRGGGEATLALDELEECIRLCDGLLFTGGHDVNPGRERAGKSNREICFASALHGENDLHPALLVCGSHR